MVAPLCWYECPGETQDTWDWEDLQDKDTLPIVDLKILWKNIYLQGRNSI